MREKSKSTTTAIAASKNDLKHSRPRPGRGPRWQPARELTLLCNNLPKFLKFRGCGSGQLCGFPTSNANNLGRFLKGIRDRSTSSPQIGAIEYKMDLSGLASPGFAHLEKTLQCLDAVLIKFEKWVNARVPIPVSLVEPDIERHPFRYSLSSCCRYGKFSISVLDGKRCT